MEKEVYKGQIIQVTEEKIQGIVWERAYLPHGVIIFPIRDDGKILFINEKRPHENPPHRIKPVSGIYEPDKGSTIENAQRELQEEIGFKATHMELLWTMKSTGTVNNEQHFFIARGLIPSKLPNPDGEDIVMEIIAFSPEELKNKLMREEIRWSMSTLGAFKLLAKIGTLG